MRGPSHEISADAARIFAMLYEGGAAVIHRGANPIACSTVSTNGCHL